MTQRNNTKLHTVTPMSLMSSLGTEVKPMWMKVKCSSSPATCSKTSRGKGRHLPPVLSIPDFTAHPRIASRVNHSSF